MKVTRIHETIVIIAALLLVAWSPAAAGSHTQTLNGAITAIDLDHKTVVVDVPLGDQKLTVGGPVADNAQLRKGGRTTDLNGFKIGDRVSVTWQKTGTGIVIHRLETRN